MSCSGEKSLSTALSNNFIKVLRWALIQSISLLLATIAITSQELETWMKLDSVISCQGAVKQSVFVNSSLALSDLLGPWSSGKKIASPLHPANHQDR